MPVDPNLFPLLPSTTYGTEQLHQYLATLVAQGHVVYRDPKQQNVFYIILTDTHRIRISVAENRSQVQLHYLGNTQGFLDVTSLPDLEKALATFASSVPGSSWPNRPLSGRLRSDTPATNYRTISGLIGSAQVVAIFDPYLDNNTLEELRIILSFGNGTVANGVRILGCAEKSQGKAPTFTASGVAAWLKQQGISGEARVFPAKTEHRRFLLLNDGRTLITGHSLNAPHKNEVVHLDTGNEDRTFFETTWNTSKPL
jgi:hypothetical protein